MKFTPVVMKFITYFHDHGSNFHDHSISFHDQGSQILYISQFYSFGHEITPVVMNGTLRFGMAPFFLTFFLAVMKSSFLVMKYNDYGHEIYTCGHEIDSI